MKPRFKRSALIEKIEEQTDGTLHVSGFASTEERDSDGEMILASAMSEALPGYMKWGAVREMHQPKAAGVALESSVDEETKKTAIRVHVVDPVACEKVRKNVYKAFSISGPILERDAVDPSVIKRLKWIETSLVDRPANEGATIDEVVIVKADGLLQVDKSLWSVSRLSELLASLDGLRSSAEWDAEGTSWPESLKAGIVSLCDTLRTMVAEETDAIATDSVALVAKIADLEASLATVTAERDEQKAIVRLDSQFLTALGVPEGADLATVEKMAGERTDADLVMKLSAATDALAKMQGARDDALAKVAALNTKIEQDAADLALAVETMKAKGFLRVVEKVNDGRDTPLGDEINPDDPDAARQAIKKVHASGGQPFMTAGLR